MYATERGAPVLDNAYLYENKAKLRAEEIKRNRLEGGYLNANAWHIPKQVIE